MGRRAGHDILGLALGLLHVEGDRVGVAGEIQRVLARIRHRRQGAVHLEVEDIIAAHPVGDGAVSMLVEDVVAGVADVGVPRRRCVENQRGVRGRNSAGDHRQAAGELDRVAGSRESLTREVELPPRSVTRIALTPWLGAGTTKV